MHTMTYSAGMACPYGYCSGAFSLALLGATAALGYWVLRHAFKDQGAVRWAGQAVGWVLLIGGLIGFVCGGLCKICPRRSCPLSKSPTGLLLPEGHPPVAPENSAEQ